MWKTKRIVKPQEIAKATTLTRPSKVYPYKVCICGVIRDGEKYFKTTMINLNKIAKCFEASKIIIVESDSTDNTVKLFGSQKDVLFHSMGNLSKEIPTREERIAVCRNFYLQTVVKNFSTYDLMLVIDLDDVMEETFDTTAFEQCLDPEVYPTWHAVFANQSYRYYDIWALRNSEVDYDCWSKIHSGEMTKIEAILKHQYHIPRNSPMIPVISAFGGMGLYKISALDFNCKYVAKQNDRVSCEHVHLNTYLTSKGCKLFIDPMMILETPITFAKYYV